MEALRDITETTGLFYYMTMKEYERAECNGSEKKKYRKLNSKEKQEVHQIIHAKRDEIFNLKKVTSLISGMKLDINNYEELFELFSKINLIDFIRIAKSEDSFFTCTIINGNYAWISKSQMGHYRYFSKGKNTETIGFDIVDLLEIYFGYTTSKTIDYAVRLFKIKFMEGIWMNEQNKKYLSNLTLIHNAKKHIKTDYPFVYNYIKNHLKLLETLNVLGNINVKKQEFSYDNQNIFFASNAYIADFLGNYTVSTTNKVLNLFTVLGLIKKVAEGNIPPQLLHESKAIAERRNLGNIVSYYVVPPMTDVIDKAEERAIVMEQHNIRYSSISKEKISFAFGEEFANQIYVQEIQKNKIKNNQPLSFVHCCLESNLIKLLDSKFYATKNGLAKTKVPNTTLKQREREIEKIWRTLLVKHNLAYIKPNNEMKAKLQLKNSEYIAMRNTII